MPLMAKGSCYHVLRALRKTNRLRDGQGLGEDAVAAILRETLLGLDYIHSHGQIHRDIKCVGSAARARCGHYRLLIATVARSPAAAAAAATAAAASAAARRAGNILLSADGRVAIADFGVAGWMSEAGDRSTKGPCKTFVGTPCWMAPEVMEQTRGYNEKADIWSVGITALELFKGYAPYAKLPPMQVLIKTIREPAPTLRAYGDEKTPGLPAATDRFQKFVARCLQKDPRDRCVVVAAARAARRGADAGTPPHPPPRLAPPSTPLSPAAGRLRTSCFPTRSSSAAPRRPSWPSCCCTKCPRWARPRRPSSTAPTPSPRAWPR